MRTIVSKFGGSSMADAGCFARVRDIVRRDPDRRCVVLSAPGIGPGYTEKVTEGLDACWRSRADHKALAAPLSRVRSRFAALAHALHIPLSEEDVEAEIMKALSISRDAALSRGEYLCTRLFARYSGLPFVDAAEVIVFDSSGGLNESETRARLQSAARRFPRFVLPGFYGTDPRGSLRTFPRNGSDITGAIAAASLDADLYENWTDVQGLMTADPSIVPEARLIPQISYRQMRSLCRAGARVLHPDCLEPTAAAGIPTRLRNTFDAEHFGTLIDDRCEGEAPCIVSRVERESAAQARISVFGFPLSRIVDATEALPARSWRASDGCLSFAIPLAERDDALRRVHRALFDNRMD